jgi:hypothetical protein
MSDEPKIELRSFDLTKGAGERFACHLDEQEGPAFQVAVTAAFTVAVYVGGVPSLLLSVEGAEALAKALNISAEWVRRNKR